MRDRGIPIGHEVHDVEANVRSDAFTFERVAGGTRVTWADEIELGGMLGPLEPLMGRMVRRGYEADLGRLKAILEAQPAKGA